jgi:hypothetical protein
MVCREALPQCLSRHHVVIRLCRSEPSHVIGHLMGVSFRFCKVAQNPAPSERIERATSDSYYQRR